MMFYNITTGQWLSECNLWYLVKDTVYDCCSQSLNVWIAKPNNIALNEYQWQQYFITKPPTCNPYSLALRYQAGQLPTYNLAQWNTLLNGNYTSLTVLGNDALLTGGSNVTIPAGAFHNAKIVSIVDDGSVVDIHNNCFHNSLLSQVVLSGLTECKNDVFKNCPLTYIYLPACVQLGTSTGNNQVFHQINGQTIDATFNQFLENAQGAGIADGDIIELVTNNTVTLTYI